MSRILRVHYCQWTGEWEAGMVGWTGAVTRKTWETDPDLPGSFLQLQPGDAELPEQGDHADQRGQADHP